MSLLAIGAMIGAVGEIYSGVSAMNAANQSAAEMRGQGEVLFNESLRTAAIIEEEGYKFGAMQSLQYIGSGVEVAGSALITIAQTNKYAAAEAEAVKSKGRTQRNLAYTTAERTENEGRASLVSGILGGASKFASVTGGGSGRTIGKTKVSGSSNVFNPDISDITGGVG